MFDNVSEKLETFFKIYFWVAAVIDVIIGICIFSSISSGYKYSRSGPPAALLLLIVVGVISAIAMSYLISLIGLAFVSVVSDCGTTAKVLAEMNEGKGDLLGNRNASNGDNHSYIGARPLNKNNAPTEWKCPKCGNINPNYTGTC